MSLLLSNLHLYVLHTLRERILELVITRVHVLQR